MRSSSEHPRIWYAAYGSNIERERFQLYIDGGTHPVTGRVTPGCREQAPPEADRAIELDHPILFARRSKGWEGAIAFLDDRSPGRTLGRAWLVTASQLLDVVAQECGREPGTVPAGPLGSLSQDRRSTSAVPDGWYGRLVWCGAIDGIPVVTCTAAWDLRTEEPTAPSASYLATIVRGLCEIGHDPEDVVHYLQEVPGVAPHWTAARIHALVPR